MWQLAVPIVLCACDGDGIILAVVGVVALFIMHRRMSSHTPRMYGPEPYVSARLSVERTGEADGGVGEVQKETSERVPNPRKGMSDTTETVEAETVRVPETHIVGFRWKQSSDSRSRLLARQKMEMRDTLHQYE